MNVTLSRAALLGLIAQTAPATDRAKGAVDAYKHLYFWTEGGRLQALGWSAGLRVASSVPASDVRVTEDGGAAVDASMVEKRVTALPVGDVELQVMGSNLRIQTAGLPRRYMMPIWSTDRPEARPGATGASFSLKTADLRVVLEAVIHAASTDETRAHVNAVRLEVHPACVRAVATDGNRLALAEKTIEGGTPVETLLSLKGALVLRDALRSGPAEMQMIPGRVMGFELGTARYELTAVEATFPPYRQVMPAESGVVVRLAREALLAKMQGMTLAADDKVRGVLMRLTGGKLAFYTRDADGGVAYDELEPAAAGARDTTHWQVNGRFFIEGVKAAATALPTGTEVELDVNKEPTLNPLILRTADQNFTLVLMPQRGDPWPTTLPR